MVDSKRVQERLPEPTSIEDQNTRQYLEELVRALRFNYDNIEADQSETVDSLNTDVIPEGDVNLYYEDERVDDRVGSLLTEGVAIDLTYDDGADTLEIAAEIATEAEGAAGTSNTVLMTPLRVQEFFDLNPITGTFIESQTFNATGTWTKPANCTQVLVYLVAGGGGAGGVASTGSGEAALGGAGGAGGGVILLIQSSLGATETVTIGVGGAGGALSGSIGGTSSFGLFCSATGGGLGAGGSATSSFPRAVKGGSGGLGAGGDVDLQGGNGEGTYLLATSQHTLGQGGYSMFGGGARGDTILSGGKDGLNATSKGSGGAAAGNTSSQSARTGGDGADGCAIIYAYT